MTEHRASTLTSELDAERPKGDLTSDTYRESRARGSRPRSGSTTYQRGVALFGADALWLLALEQVAATVGFELIASTHVAAEIPRLVEEHTPELLIADLDEDEESIDRIAEARLLGDELKIVVLAAEADSRRIQAAFDAGVSAYVLKSAQPEHLALAITETFEPSIYFGSGSAASPPHAPFDGPRLTRRELEILQLVARGASNAAVAKGLWVTEQTVKFHLSNVYRKLSVSNRTEASRWAQVHGLLTNGSVDSAPSTNGSHR
jgi:DNA-binding NarL/FixJ family response regulator